MYETLGEEIKSLALKLKVSQATATTVMGYVMKLTDKMCTATEVEDFISQLIKTKTPQELNMDERLLCVAVGALKRKQPFKANASKIGRNDQCPCGSGAKYKTCCLELAKEHDHRRYYEGN